MLQLLWNTIAYSGMTLVRDESEQKNVLLLNTLSVLLTVFTLVFTVINMVILPPALDSLAKAPLLYLLFLPLVLWLNGRGHRTVARLIFTLSAMVFMGAMSYWMGKQAYFHFYLFSVAVVSFYIFPGRQRAIMYALALLAMVQLVLSHIYLPDPSPHFPVAQEVLFMIGVANLSGTAFLVMALSAYISRVYEVAESYLHLEREKSEKLLLNILPAPIVEKLRESPETIAERFEECTILFSDIVGFTEMAGRMSAVEVVSLLNRIFSEFDDLAEKHGLEKIKTIGDAYMVVGGLPEPHEDHAEKVARFSLDMLAVVQKYRNEEELPLEIRIGIASGDAVAGVIGKKKFVYDLWGSSVNTASRMESSGLPGRVQVTESTYTLLREKFRFEDRGPIELKGMGAVQSYLLLGETV
ncbi:MAG: adenylate/guanylate cyclase domain-containing protein [Leptospiraceae bacterium]|nr:adenylate/guanylate cyclase domain-containing protein [Leptospiraceae bacterium]